MEQWQVDLFERITRMEANQEHMKSSILELPQSKKCELDINDLDERVTKLDKFRDDIQSKVAYIGGVIVMIGAFVPFAIQWLIAHLQIKLG